LLERHGMSHLYDETLPSEILPDTPDMRRFSR
jgi:hypothetical protein